MSQPAHPARVGGHPTPGDASHLALAGSLLLVAIETELLLFDVRTPAEPKLLGALPGIPISDLAVSGHHAFIASAGRSGAEGALVIVDIADPTRPRVISRTPGLRPFSAVAVVDNLAYLTGEGAGLHLFNVSDRLSPRRVGGNSAVSGERCARCLQRSPMLGIVTSTRHWTTNSREVNQQTEGN